MVVKLLQGHCAGIALLALVGCGSAPVADEVVTDEIVQETADAPEMSMEDMMARMAELGTPGEHHGHLNLMVGRFNAVTKMWGPGVTEPEVSNAVMDNNWILGRRYLVGTFTGSMAGQEFQGMSIMGYDNANQCYQGMWLDSMSTQILPMSTGTCSNGGKLIEMSRSGTGPLGMPFNETDVLTIVDENTHTFEMFNDGEKTMEITYTRAK